MTLLLLVNPLSPPSPPLPSKEEKRKQEMICRRREAKVIGNPDGIIYGGTQYQTTHSGTDSSGRTACSVSCLLT